MPKGVAGLLAIYQRDKGTCHLCGEFVEWQHATRDHVQPKSMGGPTVRANLRLAHKRCNGRRGNEWNWPVDELGRVDPNGHAA